MSGHDGEFVIRLPDRLWQRLIDLYYMEHHAKPDVAETFAAAERGKLGGGHARYVKGTHQVLRQVLASLHDLTSEIRTGEYKSWQTFGLDVGTIERCAYQRVRPAADVTILAVPVPPEAADMTHEHKRQLPARPVAHYIVVTDGGFHWLERHSSGGIRRISPYTDPFIAQDTADYLNDRVQWEATGQ